MGHAKLTSQDHTKEWPLYLKKVSGKDTELDKNSDEPAVVLMGGPKSETSLEKLISSKQINLVIDSYDEQFAELLLSLNAHLYHANEEVQINSVGKALKDHYGSKKSWQLGAWVYYPWSKQLVHTLSPDDFINLRTIRNRDLITSDEQQALYGFSVGCVGMSVGSASALALVQGGISKNIKIADGAVISGSNLNRILTNISSVGLRKDLVIGRMLYEMNPFIKVRRYGKITNESIHALFDEGWKLQAVIDEIDDLETKIRLRIEARKRKIPVFMATELADSVMLDVERFDVEPDRPLFHGMIPGIEEVLHKKDMNHREWMKHAARIIGSQNMPLDMQQSILKIGSTIVTHPQLGSTVLITGGVTTYAIKQVALGKPMPSGRTLISLNESLVPEYRSRAHKRAHRRHTKIIDKALDSM
ncbi:MAG TPA: ThiF family adenylyltransferase [Candidatus Saccharimonadales bacterium]|nr:ThiF family adenylyltransferase [Candidatus Saccharimonadales bacterium]